MIALYADTSNLVDIASLSADSRIMGFTTNPSLMRKAGVTDYLSFIPKALAAARGKPISFEVVEGSADSIYRQARKLAMFGPTVYVKVPIIQEDGTSLLPVIGELSAEGVRVNVTAVCTLTHIKTATEVLLRADAPSILSIFAGRIADTGIDPEHYIRAASCYRCFGTKKVQILWASTREVFNVQQAERAGADIITVSPELLKKYLEWTGRSLDRVSADTVAQFNRDALESSLFL